MECHYLSNCRQKHQKHQVWICICSYLQVLSDKYFEIELNYSKKNQIHNHKHY